LGLTRLTSCNAYSWLIFAIDTIVFMKLLFFCFLFVQLAMGLVPTLSPEVDKAFVLATETSLAIQVIRLSNCEKRKNQYLIIHKTDSILFLINDRCKAFDPLAYKDTVSLELKQLDGSGEPELILQFQYVDEGFHPFEKVLYIFNLDTKKQMFYYVLEAYGQKVYGEELGPFYGFKNTFSITKSGAILIQKPPLNQSKSSEEVYQLSNGIFVRKD
jgi:hypothetical protein